MTVPYVKFMKHAEKITKAASKDRPVLKGVFHADDGSLAVTDSRRLYFAKNAHTNESNVVIDPKTGAIIDGNYPDIKRHIPDPDDAKYTVKLDVKEAVEAFNALLKSNHVRDKKYDITADAFISKANKIVFKVDNGIMHTQYKPNAVIDGQNDIITSFNTKYFAEALAMFKGVGVEEVILRNYGSLSPFTLSVGRYDDLLALILPIRRV